MLHDGTNAKMRRDLRRLSLCLDALKASIARDDFHHQGSLPNNFMQTLPAAEQAFRAINTFKDEYLPKHGEL